MAGRKDVCGFGTAFDSKRWLAMEITGVLGCCFSYCVHFFAIYVIVTKLIENSPVSIFIFATVYMPVSLLAMRSLFLASTTDPGAVPLGARPLVTIRRASSVSENGENVVTTTSSRRAMRRCHKCNDNYKPPRAHHDSVTGRCIVKFDHYCPWVGNAVGQLNHKLFCLFIFYTILSCITALLLLVLRVIHCGYYTDSEDEEQMRPVVEPELAGNEGDSRFLQTFAYKECESLYSGKEVLALLFVSLIFMVFCCTMGCEQLEAINSGQGKIARMKMRVGNHGTEFARVTEEFNEMFGGTSPEVSWHWFWPARPKYPRGMEKVVLGYDYDSSYPAVACPDESEGSECSPIPSDPLRDTELTEMENGVSQKSQQIEKDGLVRTSSDLSARSRRRNRSGNDSPMVV